MPTSTHPPEVPALLGASVLTHTAWVALDDGAGGVDLPITGGRVTFDEERSPRAVAELDMPLPAARLYEQLDPRSVSSVAVLAGYRHPAGWASSELLLDGLVVDRNGARPSDALSLRVESTERVVIDAAATKVGTTVNTSSRTGAARRIVNLAFPVDPTWIDTTSDAVAATDVDLDNRDKWDLVRDLVDQADCDIYDRGDRVWVIEPRRTTTGTPVHALTTGPAGTVIDARSRTTRGEGFANRVQLIYEWTNATPAARRIQSIRDITTGMLAVTAGNVVTHREVRNIPSGQGAADNAAASLVRRKVNRGSFYDVTAPSAYWVRPGDTVTLDLPAGGDANLIVSRVTFDLGTGSMDLALRFADLTSTVGAPL